MENEKKEEIKPYDPKLDDGSLDWEYGAEAGGEFIKCN